MPDGRLLALVTTASVLVGAAAASVVFLVTDDDSHASASTTHSTAAPASADLCQESWGHQQIATPFTATGTTPGTTATWRAASAYGRGCAQAPHQGSFDHEPQPSTTAG
ncbi:hypothetical protein [Nocardioides sp.]|uniref:hypothetical protein n=1 Tax=Nocardioides sp. TaxID=35761 RepID=UPI0026396937|nr:hypothetical protein [Nocardioides sp.]